AGLTQRLTTREFNGLRNAKGVKVAGIYGNEVLIMNLNFKTPPFDNPKVRQAIAYAMPYQQIATVGYAGSAQRMDGHFSRSLNGYTKPSTQYPTDIPKAKQLLAEAGYPDGKGLEKFPDAFKLAFVAERESFLGPIATVIQSGLKDIGIPVQLDPLPQTQMSDRRIVKKDLPMALSYQEKPVGPDVGYATNLVFVTAASGGVNTFGHYSSAEADRLFDERKVEMDDPQRLPLLKQIHETLQTDLAWLP